MQVSQLEMTSDAIAPLHGSDLSKQLCNGHVSELDMYVSTAHGPHVTIEQACGLLDVCWLSAGPAEGSERGHPFVTNASNEEV